VNCSLSTTGVTSVYKVCEREEMMERISTNILENIDLGNGVLPNRVGQFCYLEDMLSGGANSASVTRVCFALGQFRELLGTLIRKDASLKLKGKVCVTCVRSAMVYRSETLATNAQQTG